MANEISLTTTFTLANNNLSYSSTETFNADQAVLGGPSNGVQLIGTAYESLGVTDITSLGWAKFKNLDNSNWIEVGLEISSTFYPFIRLLPGESVVVRLSPNVGLFAQSNTTPARLETNAFEL